MNVNKMLTKTKINGVNDYDKIFFRYVHMFQQQFLYLHVGILSQFVIVPEHRVSDVVQEVYTPCALAECLTQGAQRSASISLSRSTVSTRNKIDVLVNLHQDDDITLYVEIFMAVSPSIITVCATVLIIVKVFFGL